ncbi:MAG: galactokinase [Filifactoraceae bacterium]
MNNIEMIIKNIENNRLDEDFRKLYLTEEGIKKSKERYIELLNNFKKFFGDMEVEIYSAPGRTEIIGNHTDHQQGKVLACSIDLDAVAIVSKRDDSIIRIVSEGFSIKDVDIENLVIDSSNFGTAEAIIKGVVAGFKKEGYKFGGFSAYMNSTVLGGSGLSSSAAFEVLIGTILSGLYNNMDINPIKIAQIGQYAENKYFGKPCGLMDQLASSVGGFVYIDFKDKDNPEVVKLDFDFEKMKHSLCIVDTGGSHVDLTDDYGDVPLELKVVSGFWGKDFLRDCSELEFYENIRELRKIAGDRGVLRAIHIFEENKRVDKLVEAINNSDFMGFKDLIIKSGKSSFMYLQNVYTVKNLREQGLSLALALTERFLDDKGAWRVHGGGFAGTILAFVQNETLMDYKKYIEEVFGEGSCYCLGIRSVGGIKFI